jgi:hypothetical protein
VYHPVGEKQATSTLVKCSLAGNSAQQPPNQGLAMPTKSHASQQRKAIAKAATKAEDEEYSVRVKFVWDDTNHPDAAIAFNADDTYYYDYEWDGDYIDFSLPAGTYNFLAHYINDTFGPQIFVVREDVEVNSDMTLVLDAAEATNTLQFRAKLPSGDYARLPYADFSESAYDPTYDYSQCNVDNIYFNEFMYHEDCGLIASMSGSAGYERDVNGETMSGEAIFDYRINNVSDKFKFVQFRAMPDKDANGVYGVLLQTNGTANLKIENDVANYHHYEETFQPTPLYEQMGCETYNSQIIIYNLLNEELLGEMDCELVTTVPAVDYCLELPADDDAQQFNTLIYPKRNDYQARVVVWEEYDDEGNVIDQFKWPVSYGVYGLPIRFTADGYEYVNNNHSIYGDYGFQMPEGGGTVVEYPGHPAFSFMQDAKVEQYGNSAPINAFMTQTVNEEDFETPVVWFKPCYIGQLGEVRESDTSCYGLNILHDGESVLDDNLEEFNFEDWAWEWAETEHDKGLMQIYMVNNNISVDGVSGENYMIVAYDENNEDLCAPTLQMLHFVNNDGTITTHFANADEGTLEFAGGDFNWHDEDGNWWFDEKEATVCVEYAPYQSDDFTELEATEVPELYTIPGFGHFYRASLASVDKESTNGWYDLRIRLTDAAGNYQLQTISPAFKIDDQSGLKQVTADSTGRVYVKDGTLYVEGADNATVAVYTTDGRRVPTINLTPGLYLVTLTTATQSTTHKLLVK